MDNDYRSMDLAGGVQALSMLRPPCALPVLGARFSLASRGGGMANRYPGLASPRLA